MKLKQYLHNSDLLNIGAIEESKVIGPGNRLVIWLQGCSIKCENCINGEFIPNKVNKLIKVKDLLEIILNTQSIEGVTYSGGEPFDQARGLYLLSKLVKKSGLTIMAYSGYTLDEIKRSSDKFKRLLLSCCDILIDGRYEHTKAAPLLWRGSTNQKVYFLTPVYENYKELVDKLNLQVEFSFNFNENKTNIKGNFDKRLIQEIKKRLELYGIKL